MSFLGDAFSIPSKATTTAAPASPPPEVTAPPSEVSAPSLANAAPSSVSVPIAPGLPGANPLAPAPNASAPEPGALDAHGHEPTAETLVVSITPRAAQEVRRIVEEQKLPATTGLRLGVQGGGCSGFSYKLGFEAMKAPLDWEGECEGISIFIDPKSFLYLSGVELDFQDSLMGRGFVFNNPNAKKTCGCGESFQA